ncbi:ATP-binding protein [Microbulbifer thermotolerans]|uniref:histidine kinase n=1 Tax=Microbulbifer thermotolerans TaxID=252514 RepID=A0A143HK70_MICTH|nr:ATP-binding protein [Microbulbifer thermotolerans]AMX01886.1 histidine kinase [Microbulbifer thermotolerans]MCX2781681.1 ATP-binding protein [Microbulbifer thermotolerans]MCX2793553.1 ATP-binding protein [Microbulbifer thermotolerans]MCX2801577.1 ATP-binding protein [Microbulbifer thermotolerans]MCX2840736.1 ATP-binding protein [Microbulbifer thermotolerans]
MSFEIAHIALIGVVYIATLFFVAFASSKGWLPSHWMRHPLVYVLSLGVSLSAWTYYGIVDLARQYGYGVLAYYLGTGGMFLFAPVALEPLARLCQRYQLTSPADLLVFRYHSRLAGTLSTLFMLLALLPLIALQIQAVSETLALLSQDSVAALALPESGVTSKNLIAFLYCVLLTVFTSMYGTTRDRHAGLVSAMALESVVKVVALLAVGAYAIYGVFGGFGELDKWLAHNSDMQQLLYTPIQQGSSHTLLLVFIATAVAMPHIFYLSVAERPTAQTLRHASWGFPLFLLLMALPIFPIMWAGFALGVSEPVQYFALAVPRTSDSALLTILAFIGGLSAATGALVMMTLALSTMVMNQWLLPGTRWHSEDNMYRQLVWLRRSLVGALFLAGFGFYLLLGNRLSLSDLALLAFIASLQFLPGIFAVIHWPRGNRRGFIGGLVAGMLIWAGGLLLPSIFGINSITLPGTELRLPLGMSIWTQVTTLSLALNVLLFVGLSLLTRSSSLEQYAADLCSDDTLAQALRLELDVESAADFRLRLAESLGAATATQEVNRALRQLNLPDDERRPYALRQLRNKLEANLSGLLGRVLAGQIIDRHFPFKDSGQPANKDIHLIETRLSRYKNQLTGLAAELNNLRLYHRQMLEELPLAACSLGRDGEILLWNYAMADLTGIAAGEVLGSKLEYLAEPWRTLLTEFAKSTDASRFKQQVSIDGNSHWLNLHKTRRKKRGRGGRARSERGDAQMLLLEDITETQILEQELIHSERLASVGRLAAGVAHEVGNPVTGIACLAQNLQFESDSPAVRDTADQILSQTQRISRIVHSLVNFSHSGSHDSVGERAPVDLHACVQEAVQLLSLQRDKAQVTFDNAVPEDLMAPGDNQRLIQVFINLLSNARDVSADGGHIRIDGCVEGGAVKISVTDDGPGIPPEHRDRILEPFFTTKEPGEGTGLGLAMVYSIVEEHGGQLELVSPANPETGRGAKFVVHLPMQERAQEETPEPG